MLKDLIFTFNPNLSVISNPDIAATVADKGTIGFTDEFPYLFTVIRGEFSTTVTSPVVQVNIYYRWSVN